MSQAIQSDPQSDLGLRLLSVEEIQWTLLEHPYFIDEEAPRDGSRYGKCSCGAKFQGGFNSPSYAEHVAGALRKRSEEKMLSA